MNLEETKQDIKETISLLKNIVTSMTDSFIVMLQSDENGCFLIGLINCDNGLFRPLSSFGGKDRGLHVDHLYEVIEKHEKFKEIAKEHDAETAIAEFILTIAYQLNEQVFNMSEKEFETKIQSLSKFYEGE